jgi:hypothetical protein
MPLFRRVQPPFGLKTLQKDSNCVLIQDPSTIWGGSDHLPRRNLLLATDTLATQNVTVTAEAHTLYLQGTGSVTLSGTGSGTLQGTGANDRVTLAFTPTAGTLTLTVSGTVTFGMLCKSSVMDRSYQKITDWTTEQYAWAAQNPRLWLRRNMLSYTDLDSSGWTKQNGGTGVSPVVTKNYGIAPDGTTTACRLQLDRGAGTSSGDYSQYLCSSSSSPATAVGSTYARGVWLKLTTGSTPVVVQTNDKGSAGSSALETVTDAWQYFEHSAVADSTARSINIRLVGNAATSQSVDILAWHPSFGPGSSAPVYQHIATTWPAEYTALALAAGYPISLYSDRAGTTATVGPDDPVGVLLDGSEGYALGPELVTNGTFTTDITGWDRLGSLGTASWSSGEGKFTYSTTSGGLKQTLSLVVGKAYAVSANVRVEAGSVSLRILTAAESGYVWQGADVSFASGVLSGVFVATETNSRVYFRTGSVGVTNTYYLDNVSVREIPGYHATAPSVAGSPTLRLDGNGKFYLDRDTTDDNLPITWPTVLSESQLGPELVGDPGFNGGGWWTASTGVTINAGVATFDGTNASGYVRRESVTTEGKTYLFTCVLGSRTAGTLRFALGSGGATQLPDMTAAGTYSALFTMSAANAGRIWLISTAGPFAGTVDSFSIKEVTGTNVQYVADQSVTTETTGLLLSGATNYTTPQRPTGDYGRVIFKAPTPNAAKVKKYLDKKAGR